MPSGIAAVETMFATRAICEHKGPCFLRLGRGGEPKVYDLFNEKLIRTQDREFNSQLIKAGGTIILDPSVGCTYFSRTSLIDYIKWNFTGACWLFYARRFTNIRMASWRNYVPLSFLFHSLFFLIMLSSTIPNQIKIITAIPLLVYLSLYFSIEMSFKKKNLLYIPLLFLIFPVTHYSYALGSLYGIIKARILGKDVVNT